MPAQVTPGSQSSHRKIREDYILTEQFVSGYQDKLQIDEVPPGTAVAGSQNFILDDDGKWTTRPGTKYFGTKNAASTKTTSSGKLTRRDGTEIPLVPYGTLLKIFHPGKSDWMDLMTGLTSGYVWGFAENDLNTDNVNRIAFGNSQDSYQVWNGATAMFSSATVNTVTVQGATSLANLGFTATGTIIIEGVPYTYTGLSGQQFTGVSPDPSGAGYTTSSGIAQQPVAYSGNPKGNVLLGTSNARIIMQNVIASGNVYGGGQIYGSKTASATDFTFSSPRLANDGFIINIPQGGDIGRGMCEFEGGVACFKKSTIYKLSFSTDGNDTVQLVPLLPFDAHNSYDVGSVSALAVFRLGQSICFVSPSHVINTLQRVQNYDYPLPLAISDPIKATIDAYSPDSTTSGGTWRGRAFFGIKSTSTATSPDRILVYNERYQCFETPIVGLNPSSFFAYGGNWYITDFNTPNALQMWTGTTDYLQPSSSGIPINATLNLSKMNFGWKSKRKTFTRVYLEFDMFQTGSFTFAVKYNENGSTRSVTIHGTDSGLSFSPSPLGAFGTEAFGTDTFGPTGTSAASSTDPVRYRVVLTTKDDIHFYNIQPSITTSGYFKLIAIGFNIHPSLMVTESSRLRALS